MDFKKDLLIIIFNFKKICFIVIINIYFDEEILGRYRKKKDRYE